MTEIDPLVRLLKIIDALKGRAFEEAEGITKNSDGHILFGPAICALLERAVNEGEKFSRENQSLDYRTLLIMCTDAENFVQQVSPERAKASNLNAVYSVTNQIRANSVDSIATSISNFMDGNTIERMRLVSDNFAHLGGENVITNEEIHGVVEIVDDLITFIQKSSLEDRLRDVLLRTLGNLRMELTRVNIVGPMLVAEELDKLIGQSVRAALAPGSDEQKRDGRQLLTGAVGLSEQVGKLIDFGQKIYPVLEKGAELARQLLP